MSIDVIEAICVMCLLLSPVMLVVASAGYAAIDDLAKFRRLTYTRIRWTLALIAGVIPGTSLLFAILGAMHIGDQHEKQHWIAYIVVGVIVVFWSLEMLGTLILHTLHQWRASKDSMTHHSVAMEV